MAEVLSELVARITADSTELKRGLSEAESNISNWVKNNERQFRTIGIALAGLGATIMGTLGMATKAAADEQVGINRLAMSMKNVGVSYDNVKASLEAVIKATQRKTGVADNEQRDILSRLILVTKDYNQALSLLPTALDLAAAGQMDAVTAATYLGKAYEELQQGADKISIRLGRASLEFKSLAEIQNAVKGSAEAMVNPFDVIKNEMDDLFEKIGTALLPSFKKLVEAFIPIIDKVVAWIDANPELVQQLLLLAVAVGGVATILGPILVMLPTIMGLMTAFGVVTGGIALGPIALIILGITSLIAIGFLLYQNWETVKTGIVNIWNTIVDAVIKAVNTIIGWINTLIGLMNKIPGVNIGAIAPIGGGAGRVTRPAEILPAVGATMPGYQYGGKIPGRIGEPVPILAHAGETVLPVGRSGGVTINLNVAGSILTERNLEAVLREALLKIARRNVDVGF